MNVPEVEYALETLTLLVDTREQPTPLFHRRMKAVGLPYERCKLDAGDYSAKVRLPGGEELLFDKLFAIERKMSLDELAQNLTRGRARFEREFIRAKKAGTQMYLLVEGGSFEKVFRHQYRTQMHSSAFIASITAWLVRYRCQIVFCDALTTPQIIREICKREVREHLMGMVEDGD